jgi:phosphonate transport system substrate-binding protein
MLIKSFSLKHLLLLVLLVSTLVTACSPSATAATNPAPNTPATAAPAATADPHAGWPSKFIVGMFAGDDPQKVTFDNEAFRAYLEKQLGIPVEIITGGSYSAVIEAMRVKKADAMSVGPFSYTLAVQEANAEALGAGITADAKDPKYDAKKLPYYYSVIITKKGSGVATLADLKGKDFTFVDPASTSGHLMPKALLIKNGLDPDKDMKTVFAGSHPSSVSAVWNDKVPAGATYEGNLYNLSKDGQVDLCFWPDGELNKARTPEEIKAVYDAKLVIIGMTDPIPNTPFAIRSDLPASFKAEVKAALLAIKDHPELVPDLKRWYVDPSQDLGLKNLDAFYNPLREVAKLLDLDLKAMP